MPKNLNSIIDACPEAALAKISRELERGRVRGPFYSPPFTRIVASPWRLVPKKDGGYRLIHHLSYPLGSSVNAGIPSQFTSVKHATFHDAIAQLHALGSNAWLCKSDIKDAFRLMPLHPDCYHLFTFSFKNALFFDRCLPMGCAQSRALFEPFSTAVEWMAIHKFAIRNNFV